MMTRAEKNQAIYALRRRKRKFVLDHKAEAGCQDCGERDPVVLELDHREPESKDPRLRNAKKGNNVRAQLLSFSWPDLFAELEKCDVVCANCHRRRTALQQSWG